MVIQFLIIKWDLFPEVIVITMIGPPYEMDGPF